MPESSLVSVDARALKKLSADFRRIAPAAYKTVQKGIRAMALDIMAEAEANSAYSKRIPGSGKVRMAGLNARIIFGGDAAPEAAPIENKGKGDVRHPTFGHVPWTSKNSHPPFLTPAFVLKAAIIDEVLAQAVTDATTVILTER